MRTLRDAKNRSWKVELISHGQTSAYLNPRVHKPILQFTCLDQSLARRYVAFKDYASRSLTDCSDEELATLFERATAH